MWNFLLASHSQMVPGTPPVVWEGDSTDTDQGREALPAQQRWQRDRRAPQCREEVEEEESRGYLFPITAWNGTGTCLPAASAPTSSTSAAAGIQAEGNNNPVPGHPEINVSSMCVFVVKILALKLSRGSGKTCACGIYRKCKHGNQFASWKLSSEVFSRPVKPHPWPPPRRSTRPHRDTGNAGSDFRIF